MSAPMLTSDGFVGQRLIVDDYFTAGETLHAGDIAVIRLSVSPSPSLPRVYKASAGHKQRVIGVVHTPADKQVGDVAATAGQSVSIVMQGIAKALSGGGIEIGDPAASSLHHLRVPGKGLVAAVVRTNAANPDIVGRCLTRGTNAYQVIDILVDLADARVASATPVTPTTNGPPRNLLAGATTTVGQLLVTWDSPSGFDSSTDLYHVQYRAQGSSNWLPSDPIQTADSHSLIPSLRTGTTYEVRVRTSYNRDRQSTVYSNWVTATRTPLARSNDATLSALSILPVPALMVPSFSGTITSYRARVGNAVNSVRVRPTVNQANATVTVNGDGAASGWASQPINLAVGANTISVVVTAQDGATKKTYTLAVTRAPAASRPSNPPPTANPIVRSLPARNTYADFNPALPGYGTWRQMVDFDDAPVGVYAVGTSSWPSPDTPAWLGYTIPQASDGGIHHWVQAALLGPANNPTGVRLRVRNSKHNSLMTGFEAGNIWGFKLYVKPKTPDASWTYVLGGYDTLTDLAFTGGESPRWGHLAEADITIPLRTNTNWAEWFKAANSGLFEVKVDAARYTQVPVGPF